MTSPDPNPLQNLLDGAVATVRFSDDADPIVLGVTDRPAWADAINRLQLVPEILKTAPDAAASLLQDASRDLVNLVTVSPHAAIVNGGLGPAENMLANAVMLMRGSLQELGVSHLREVD